MGLGFRVQGLGFRVQGLNLCRCGSRFSLSCFSLRFNTLFS